jgi:putative membrane protein
MKTVVLAGLLLSGLAVSSAAPSHAASSSLAAAIAPAGIAPAAVAPVALAPVALAPTALGPTAEAMPDTAFLRAVHQADLAEIAGGGIAQERGVSPRVRALGARFVRDHTAIDTRLTAVARAADVLLPDTPSAAQLALTKKYQSVPASAFDRLYLRTQLAAHNEALAAGKAELADGQDPRVKQLVTYAAPLVRAHHDALTAALGGAFGRPAR